MQARAIPVERGCGRRKTGLYVEVGVGPGGRPIHDFVCDPPVPIAEGLDLVNKPRLLPRRVNGYGSVSSAQETREGHVQGERDDGEVSIDPVTGRPVVDLYVWIGEGTRSKPLYPYAPDFIEEAANYGISRHIPATLDIKQLTRESLLILAHPRAINLTWQKQSSPLECRKNIPSHTSIIGRQGPCIYKNWELIPREAASDQEITVQDAGVTCYFRQIGSSSYLFAPSGEVVEWKPGFILKVPISGFALVQKGDGDAHARTRHILQTTMEEHPTSALPFYDASE